jgi:hypothetical protein
MTTFGDIRSAIQAKSKEQLHDALAHYHGPQPTDAETQYVIDAALRYDWNLGVYYDAFHGHKAIFDHMSVQHETFIDFRQMDEHPICANTTPESLRCHIHVGSHRYRLGVLPRKAVQRWLLDCVIKPMHLWFIDDDPYLWERVEIAHARRIDSGVFGFLQEDIPVSIYRACNNLGVMHAAMANEVKWTCDGLVDAMRGIDNHDTWTLLQNSFDQYVLHYFKLPKENGLTAHQMHERGIELRAQQEFLASAMDFYSS